MDYYNSINLSGTDNSTYGIMNTPKGINII